MNRGTCNKHHPEPHSYYSIVVSSSLGARPPSCQWGNDSCQLHFLILFVCRNSIGTFGLITHNRTRKTHTKAHNTMNRYTTAITLSITAHWPPNNTDSAIDILIGESYGYSVVGARLMVVERGHWGQKEIWWSWQHADQILATACSKGILGLISPPGYH